MKLIEYLLLGFWITLLCFIVYTFFYIEEITTNPCQMCEKNVRGMECTPREGFVNQELEEAMKNWSYNYETD